MCSFLKYTLSATVRYRVMGKMDMGPELKCHIIRSGILEQCYHIKKLDNMKNRT